MKLKLMAFAFMLAFAISTFGALGVSGASADAALSTPGTCVDGPHDADGGAVTAFTAITDNTEAVGDAGLSVDFVNPCP